MTFEEDFPSLRFFPIIKMPVKRIKTGESYCMGKARFIKEKDLPMSDLDFEFDKKCVSMNNEDIICSPIIDLKQNCLDKSKVREAINVIITEGENEISKLDALARIQSSPNADEIRLKIMIEINNVFINLKKELGLTSEGKNDI